MHNFSHMFNVSLQLSCTSQRVGPNFIEETCGQDEKQLSFAQDADLIELLERAGH